MSVAIIDYGSGNLHSAAKAFERAARGMENPDKIIVTRDPEIVFRADRIVLPGVGAFADCRKGLEALDGMVDAMTEAVRDKARAVFWYLRRHAADGDARQGIRHDAGVKLDFGRRRKDRAARREFENPAYGLEHARSGARASGAGTVAFGR